MNKERIFIKNWLDFMLLMTSDLVSILKKIDKTINPFPLWAHSDSEELQSLQTLRH